MITNFVLEYCVDDSFNPQCPNGEIILMRSALYGRMRLSKCLPVDLGHMGCQSNVLSQFDQECSGKESCEVLVTDKHINAQSGCVIGLQSYLETEYNCVKGKNTINIYCSEFHLLPSYLSIYFLHKIMSESFK